MSASPRYWTFPDGTRLPVISGGDGPEGDQPAPEGGEVVEPTEVEATAYALPENLTDVEAWAPDAITAEAERLAAEYGTLRSAEVLTMADVDRLRAYQTGWWGLHAELERRTAEEAAIRDGLAALDDVPVVADAPAEAQAPAADQTPAARAAAVRIVNEGRVADNGQDPDAQPDGDAPAEERPRTASARVLDAASETWRMQRGELAPLGSPANFGGLINETRPNRSADLTSQLRAETVMATTRIETVEEDEKLGRDASANEELIAAAIERHGRQAQELAEAIPGIRTAAICDPAEVVRDAMLCGTTRTPFQDALVQLPAVSGNKLKYQYRQSTSIAEAAGSVGSWSTTSQDAITTNPSTWKPCVPITCPDYVTTTATEITACWTIDAYTELSSPEMEADFVQAQQRLWARFTEAFMLHELQQYLHHYSLNAERGTIPALIEAILTPTLYGTYPERLERGNFVVFGTPGLAENGAIDLNSKAFNQGNSVYGVDDVLGTIRQATGNDYVQLLDVPLSAANTLGTNPFPTLPTPSAGSSATALASNTNRLNTIAYKLFIIDTASFPMWSTGEGVFGEQITLDQARQNQRGFFQRTFQGLMSRGCAPGFQVDLTICPDGSRGGFTEPGCPPTAFTGTAGAAVTATPAG